MLICGSWVVVALLIVAHSAGAAGVVLLLVLFLPLPLSPPLASAAAGLISAIAAIAAVARIFLLNISCPFRLKLTVLGGRSVGSGRHRNGTLVLGPPPPAVRGSGCECGPLFALDA